MSVYNKPAATGSGETLPYKMMIGDLRRMLFTEIDSDWNAYIRDMTAELEEPGEYVNVREAFLRINKMAAQIMMINKAIK